LPLRGKDRAGRRLLSFTAGERAQHEWLVERCQTPASPSKSPRSTADPFDRREPSSPFTKRDPRRKRREPSVHPISLSGPRGCFEAPFVMYAPACCRLRQRAGCIDPKVLFRFCHRHYTRATKPQLIVLAGPEATPGPGPHPIHIRTDVASGSGCVREDDPSPTWSVCCRVSFLRPTSRRRYGEHQTHDTSRRHALGPTCAETHADLQPLPWRDRRTFEWRALREEKRVPSARGAFDRVHRA